MWLEDRCLVLVTVFLGTLPEFDTSVAMLLGFILLSSMYIISA